MKFTTIAKLVNSAAQQNRVDRVRNALKKRLGSVYHEDLVFPVLFIKVSNSVADYEWVMSATSLHVPMRGWTAAVNSKWGSLNQGKNESAIQCLKALEAFMKSEGIASVFFDYVPINSSPAPAKAAAIKAPAKPKVSVTVVPKNGLTKQGIKEIEKKVGKGQPLAGNSKGAVKETFTPIPTLVSQVKALVKGHPRVSIAETKVGIRTLTLTFTTAK